MTPGSQSPALTELPSVPTWSFPPRPYTHHVRWIGLHPTDPAIDLCRHRARWGDGHAGRWRHLGGPQAGLPARCPRHRHPPGRAGPRLRGRRRWRRILQRCRGDLAPRGRGDGPALHLGTRHRRRRPRSLVRLSQLRRAHRPPQRRRRAGASSTASGETRRGRRSAEKAPGWSARYPTCRTRCVAPRGRPQTLIAGLQNGDLLLTDDAGETWRTLHTGLDGLLALSESAR